MGGLGAALAVTCLLLLAGIPGGAERGAARSPGPGTTSTSQANITIDSADRGPAISSGLFGQNGAVWMSMNDSIARLANESGATILRWPGGESSDYYDWEADGAKGRVYRDDGTYWSPVYDTDTFIDFCRKSSCTPMVVANGVIADPQKAARWARYFINKSLPVWLWQVGNEPVFDKHWNRSLPDFRTSDNLQPTTDEWAWATREYGKALRAVDPLIRIIGPDGGAAEGSRDQVWVGEFTRKASEAIDFVDIHSYPAHNLNEADMLASPDSGPDGGLVNRIRNAQRMIAGNASGKSLPLTMTEYNSDWNNGALMGSWVNGLFVADVLLHMAQENITIANMWNLASQNEGYIDPNGTPRSSYWAFKLLRREFAGTVVAASSDAAASGYGLEAYAASRPDGSLAIAVINKKKTAPYDATVTLSGFSPEKNATVYLLDRQHNGTRVADAAVNGTTFGFRFLPYSLTVIVIRSPPPPPLSVSASAAPAAGQAPLSVQFSSTVTGAQGAVVWGWEFGDGGSDVVANPAHVYAAAGDYTARVTVRDSLGRNASDTLPIIVSPAQPSLTLVVNASPSRGTAPLDVDFDALVSGAIGTVTVTWDFGDKSSGTGASIAHTYTRAGDYTAIATARDSSARAATDSASVTVLEPLPPPPPTDVRVEYDGSGIVLAWKHAYGKNVSFDPYRQSGSAWEKLLPSPTADRTHRDSPVTAGKTYVYRVTAVGAGGLESRPSESVTVVVPAPPAGESGTGSWLVSPVVTAMVAIIVIIALAAAAAMLVKSRRRRGLQ